MRKTTKTRIQATILGVTLAILSVCSYTNNVSANDNKIDRSLYGGITTQFTVDVPNDYDVFSGVKKDLKPLIATNKVTYSEVFVGNSIDNEPEIIDEQEPECPLTDEEIELLAILTMAEAEGESELGKRLVIDTVLNRVDDERYPNTVRDVIYSGAYEAMHNGRSSECYVKEDICQLVKEESISRTNSKVLYFRTRKYHSFGTPEVHEGHHYFSS